ncbi:MAG: hypothetical protein GWM98_17410 [Nitrospinaceae bacterium]|nr:trypsin-like peptidase domain-containing protein [Nitrospinaceae bacterium]NIR55937.1 trypsin-like peptidase domain-containing protein [Nitrospinaceae bacterium]NIT83217.1 trypsin-like peptidase domain-containing protein [Nitrospinaceae bacterium]NIX35585.1 hypothetical protein [Nitrospinaceae bacterium]NIY16541.1 hypothetical protein [Nitrospinaceae bacterium]
MKFAFHHRAVALAGVCCLAVSFLANPAWSLTGTPQKTYERFSPSVFQIRIIDIRSGEKSIIGSGFSISRKGYFATNYHVISEIVNTPDRYRIEYYKGNKKQGDLTLVALDVAHDLAILKGEKRNPTSLKLGSSNLKKGAHVFPMGNPMDLGMNIIEGTFNGRIGVDPYQHILISAPLNPGMSGGPAFDASGKVMGVNVAISGNDLSYLVPVEYLIRLFREGIEQQKEADWPAVIQKQMLARQSHLIQKFVDAEISLEKFGSLKTPKNLLPAGIKCWGTSELEDLKENRFYSFGHKQCLSEGRVFLNSSSYTGYIGYSFLWMESDSLIPTVFYKEYSDIFSSTKFYPYARKKEVTEFNCSNEFVELAGQTWKGVYCIRQYKNFPDLHDVVLNFAVLGDPKRGHVIRIGLAGINEKLARSFLKKLLGGVEWTG